MEGCEAARKAYRYWSTCHGEPQTRRDPSNVLDAQQRIDFVSLTSSSGFVTFGIQNSRRAYWDRVKNSDSAFQ
jgi:hypothetical protein